MNHKNKFKDIATAMMKPAPQSMKDFLNDSQPSPIVNEESPNGLNNDLHGTGSEINQNNIVRFHVHIRQDLADKVFEAVFQRKKNNVKIKKEASQRAVIEEALELFFK